MKITVNSVIVTCINMILLVFSLTLSLDLIHYVNIIDVSLAKIHVTVKG